MNIHETCLASLQTLLLYPITQLLQLLCNY